MAWVLASDNSGKKSDLDVAQSLIDRAAAAAKQPQAELLNTQARIYSLKGNKSAAITTETKALSIANNEEKENYQRVLDAYKEDKLAQKN